MSADFYSVISDRITTEESTFTSYGLVLTSDKNRKHIFKDISTNFNAVDKLGIRIVSSDISEFHFRDIIDDYIALEADSL